MSFGTLTILESEEIYLSFNTDVITYENLKNKIKLELDININVNILNYINKYRVVIVDCRLVDLICRLSFYKPSFLVIDVREFNTVYTFNQYMTKIWLNGNERLYDSKKLSNLLCTILLLQSIGQRTRVDIISKYISKTPIIEGKYNIEILIELLDNKYKLLEKLHHQRSHTIYVDYDNIKRIVLN